MLIHRSDNAGYGMAAGSDGDDEEVVDIDLELDGPPPSPADALPRAPTVPPSPGPRLAPPPAPAGTTTETEIPDIIELRQPITEAAEADVEADRALYEVEAAATQDPARRAALLLEVARLQAGAMGETAGASGEGEGHVPEAALDTARRAFAADPGLGIALWSLRALLVRGRKWQELADACATAAQATATHGDPAVAESDRADLLVERGRVLEDRLGQDADALDSYREALTASRDHVGALLALLLIGARSDDHEVVATALDGLARRTTDGTRRSALAIEAARARRRDTDPATAAIALGLIQAELGRADEASSPAGDASQPAAGDVSRPVGTLLAELDALTAPDVPPDVAALALGEIARRSAPIDAAFAVGLYRERARLLARAGDTAAAREALDEAARLDRAHPLVAAARLELADAAGEHAAVDDIAREALDSARSDDEAVDFALLHAGMALRAGREAAAAESLGAPRVRGRRPARADLRAFELALTIRRHDRAGLANAFLAEAARLANEPGEERGQANALAAAGALWQWALGDPSVAEGMYRRALDVLPQHPPSLHALVGLTSAERAAEAAELLEAALDAEAAGPNEVALREALVSICADALGDAARALPHQRRLAALAPNDVARLVRLHDLELAGTLGLGELEVETLLSLAARAGDSAVAIALRVAAGRGLVETDDPAAVARGLALLKEVTRQDPTGLAASARERRAPSRDARVEVIEGELTSAGPGARGAAARALRFRLAHHHFEAGRYPEALAALTPLRSDGDPLARAWSYELARRSDDAILEVAVLSDETEASDAAVGDDTGVMLAYGEALARADDPGGAADALRRALAAAGGEARAADAALALLRIAALERRPAPDAVPEAMRALAEACADDPEIKAAALREEALCRVAAGVTGPADLDVSAVPDPSLRAHAEAAIIRFAAGIGLGEPRASADALVDFASVANEQARSPSDIAPLLARAVLRARLAGSEAADAIARRAWHVVHAPAVAQALSDLPVPPGESWPAGRPDTRRARAGRAGPRMGIALDLEVGLDAERRGALGTALAAYGSVISIDPDRLEAWTGIRRVARAGGDVLGEARALARLGALVLDTGRAAGFLLAAADAYQRAGRADDALVSLAKAVEVAPGDSEAYRRMAEILQADMGAPGHAELYDNLLSHRLAAEPLGTSDRVAVLSERAAYRRAKLHDRAGAFDDLKQILMILPEHREALYELAMGAVEDRDGDSAAHWLERFLAAFADDPRAPEARLDLATAYELGRERARAVDTLRRAAAIRPGDPLPLERLADLQLRAGDWRSAIEALRASEPRVGDPRGKAEVHLRIGVVLRDLGRDPEGAAASFRRAAELDPGGDGIGTLVGLHDSFQDPAGALEIARHEVARVRGALAVNPLAVPLLERLREFLAIVHTHEAHTHEAHAHAAASAVAEAEAAVASVIGLAAGKPPAVAAPRFAPRSAPAFWGDLVDPAAGGFVAEVWPNLAEAAAAIYPAAARERRAASAAESFRWIVNTAAGFGVEGLEIFAGREGGATLVAVAEEVGPALIIAPGAERAPAFRFHVGRSIGCAP